jgi:hypothetical protein
VWEFGIELRGVNRAMDPFFERLVSHAATIDEILSPDFEPITGQKDDAELAGKRLAAWCRASANSDWFLFSKRLERDGRTFNDVLARFASVRRNPDVPPPAWVGDAIWIYAALSSRKLDVEHDPEIQRIPFGNIFQEVVRQAEGRLWLNVDRAAFDKLAPSAHACLRKDLVLTLSNLSAPALYERQRSGSSIS